VIPENAFQAAYGVLANRHQQQQQQQQTNKPILSRKTIKPTTGREN